MQDLDIEKIKLIPSKVPAGKYVLECLASRQRGRAVITAENITRMLKEAHSSITLGDVVQVFKGLEEAGAGRIVIGRHGNLTRFYPDYHVISIGKLLHGENNVQPIKRKLAAVVQPKGRILHVTPNPAHTLVVRKGSVAVELPADLDPEFIAKLMKTLDN